MKLNHSTLVVRVTRALHLNRVAEVAVPPCYCYVRKHGTYLTRGLICALQFSGFEPFKCYEYSVGFWRGDWHTFPSSSIHGADVASGPTLLLSFFRTPLLASEFLAAQLLVPRGRHDGLVLQLLALSRHSHEERPSLLPRQRCQGLAAKFKEF